MKLLCLFLVACLSFGCTSISQHNEARINLLVEQNRALTEQVEQRTEQQDKVNAAIISKMNELIIIQLRTMKEIEQTRYEQNKHFL